jgi:hypothetical protein
MLAFQDDQKDSSSLFYVDTLINVMFAFDIMLIFFTAYIDDDALELVDDYKVIAILVNFLNRKSRSVTFEAGFLSMSSQSYPSI